jgi:hypothetical protein
LAFGSVSLSCASDFGLAPSIKIDLAVAAQTYDPVNRSFDEHADGKQRRFPFASEPERLPAMFLEQLLPLSRFPHPSGFHIYNVSRGVDLFLQ